MSKSLVIVESPTKAKTLDRYLGRQYHVIASQGHVMDLPASRFGRIAMPQSTVIWNTAPDRALLPQCTMGWFTRLVRWVI